MWVDVFRNGPLVPCISEIIQILQLHSVAAHIKEHATSSHMEDTTIEKNTTPSDVANVRTLKLKKLQRGALSLRQIEDE